ncbi:MAG: hypothetical protein NC400_05080 [Clostridium sp.]|nr:hypothetical protein [Clostridium sp.]
MDKAWFVKRFYEMGDEFDKALYVEYLAFCNYAEDKDFYNYLRVDDLTRAEFESVMDSLYQQKCYIMLMRLMNGNRERLMRPDASLIMKIDFREDIEKRFEKLFF